MSFCSAGNTDVCPWKVMSMASFRLGRRFCSPPDNDGLPLAAGASPLSIDYDAIASGIYFSKDWQSS